MELASILLLLSCATPLVHGFYTMRTHAPDHASIHGLVINARERSFIIGAANPTTYCGISDASQCPPGTETLINKNMTYLGSATPGGQVIFTSPNGEISYTLPGSSRMTEGAVAGGFVTSRIMRDNTTVEILTYQTHAMGSGLWACRRSDECRAAEDGQGVEWVLTASAPCFTPIGCVALSGVELVEAGDKYGAWAYT
ncbi:hypothetical protein B0I35DRAFT_407400 [Stachybotrys elegans]|uniref:Uncharacterized protein n=1 Tax=Stachybotrys elegans TaxID=80388 RepID=A0A8K0WT81_9HYPO|nr:hypothetical protein B0I35DRAFT_407400 [Stachybotrys elegans]